MRVQRAVAERDAQLGDSALHCDALNARVAFVEKCVREFRNDSSSSPLSRPLPDLKASCLYRELQTEAARHAEMKAEAAQAKEAASKMEAYVDFPLLCHPAALDARCSYVLRESQVMLLLVL